MVYQDSFGLKKNYSGEAFGLTVNTDIHRLRKNKTDFNDSFETTILLGDSVTMGVGVDDFETFASLVQDKKNNINIANPSVIGFDTYDYKNVVQSLVKNEELSVNEVIIFFCLNDIYLREASNTAPMLSGKPFIGKIFNFLKTNSYFYIWLKGTFFDRSKVFFDNDSNLYNDKNLKGISKNLKSVATICKQNNIQLKIVLLPYEYQLRNHENKTIYKPQEILKKTFKNLDITTYDSKDYMKSNIDKSQHAYLFADGIHFSEKGHQIVADYLIKEVFK
jgi:lysophospholipase L1-like esterase